MQELGQAEVETNRGVLEDIESEQNRRYLLAPILRTVETRVEKIRLMFDTL